MIGHLSRICAVSGVHFIVSIPCRPTFGISWFSHIIPHFQPVYQPWGVFSGCRGGIFATVPATAESRRHFPTARPKLVPVYKRPAFCIPVRISPDRRHKADGSTRNLHWRSLRPWPIISHHNVAFSALETPIYDQTKEVFMIRNRQNYLLPKSRKRSGFWLYVVQVFEL